MFVHGGLRAHLLEHARPVHVRPAARDAARRPALHHALSPERTRRRALSFLPQYYNVPIIGASGAVFGVAHRATRASGPRTGSSLRDLPIQAYWFIVGMVVYSIVGGLGYVGAGTAHFGHLGGIAVGWVYMGWLGRGTPARGSSRARRRRGARRLRERRHDALGRDPRRRSCTRSIVTKCSGCSRRRAPAAPAVSASRSARRSTASVAPDAGAPRRHPRQVVEQRLRARAAGRGSPRSPASTTARARTGRAAAPPTRTTSDRRARSPRAARSAARGCRR